MVKVTDHVKHVTLDLFGKIKRLKANMKKVELRLGIVKRSRVAFEDARASVKKALDEVIVA